MYALTFCCNRRLLESNINHHLKNVENKTGHCSVNVYLKFGFDISSKAVGCHKNMSRFINLTVSIFSLEFL